MARIKSLYNDIGIATEGIVDIISDFFRSYESSTYGRYLDSYIEGGYDQWKKDMRKYVEDYDFLDGPLKTGYNEESTMGIIKNRPELYARIALAKMKKAREEGWFEQLSDEEFNNLIGELIEDPSNFVGAKRRAISVKYDKALQQDLADKKGGTPEQHAEFAKKMQQKFSVKEEELMEEWTKRQWQRRAGIIK